MFCPWKFQPNKIISIDLVISNLGAGDRSMACELKFYDMFYMLDDFIRAFKNSKTSDDYLHVDIRGKFVNRQICKI